MIREAIILAGGLGTRLRAAVPDLPKCMATVAGRPFLFHVINQLRSQGIEKFVFSLGYKHEMIESYLKEEFATLSYQCVIEKEPLGTGGAIQLACTVAIEKNVVVVNGDTMFRANLHLPTHFHISEMAECTVLLKPMQNINRYGIVETNEKHLITAFKEKQHYDNANINAGVYLLDVGKFLDEEFPEKFSFEKDYLEKFFGTRRIYGLVQDAYFIDIGIPEDYSRAQEELSHAPLNLNQIDKSWTLLIDRDGVINEEKKDGYILNWEEFKFYSDTLEALSSLASKFGKIIVVSNQRGVGKGEMTESALRGLHEKMQEEIENAGGRIDKIYYCTSTDNLHPDRKPNPGMAFHAKDFFPDIDLSKTVMVGNKLSDMAFAKNAGVYSVFLATTNPETAFPHPNIDFRFNTLLEFSKSL